MCSPQQDTIPSWAQWRAQTSPNDEAVISYDARLKRTSLTYAEIDTLASRYAYILKECGVKRGDMVVNALPNCLEHIVSTLGIIMAGGANIAVEVFLNSGETFYEVLEKTKAKLLVVQRGTDFQSWNLIKDHLDMTSIAHGGMVPVTKSDNSHCLQQAFVVSRDSPNFLDYLRSLSKSYRCPDLTPEDLCMAFSTSSATSLVRLVLHTHKSIIRAGQSDSASVFNAEKKYLNNSPPTWVTNSYDFLTWPVTRVSLDHWLPLKDTTDDAMFADVFEKEKIDIVFMIPPFAEAVMNKWSPRPFPMVKTLLIGAMPVTEKMVHKLMPSVSRMIVRYMSSEVPGITYNCIKKPEEFHDFDSGVTQKGVKVRAVDDKFSDVGLKETGRILIKTEAMFKDYIGETTGNDVFSKEGWFASLDAGFLTPEGHLSVMGRRDDMILHNVWNIHPSWIEKHIKSYKDVLKVVVVPTPDEDNFQNICACIVRKPGTRVTVEQITNHYRANYVEEEQDNFCPSDILFFDQLPTKAGGHIDRRRATEVATQCVMKAKADGIPTQNLPDFILGDY